MPKTARICSRAGCPEIVIGRTYCEAHTLKKSEHRRSARAQGYDRKWEAFAKQYLQRNPTCCVIGCNSPAKDVDHIDQQGPTGPRGYDPSNLQPLCRSHHSQKTWLYTKGPKAPTPAHNTQQPPEKA